MLSKQHYFMMNPYQAQSSIKKEQKFNAQGTHYKSLIDKVNQILIRLLEDIESIYKYSGITFEVQPLLGVLMRLLTPFEIVSYFHLTDISKLINTEVNGSYARFQHKFNPNETEPTYDDHRQDLKLIPTPYEPNVRQMKKPPPPKDTKQRPESSHHRNNLKTKFFRVLTDEQEITLIQWIESKIKQNKYVRRKDISYIARKLSKVPGFAASKNWTIRFLSRYPKIRAQLDSISRANKGRKVKQNFSEISDSSQDIEKYNVNNEFAKVQQTQSNVSDGGEKEHQIQPPPITKKRTDEDSDYEIESEDQSISAESSSMEVKKKHKKADSSDVKNGGKLKKFKISAPPQIRYKYRKFTPQNQIVDDQIGSSEETIK